MSISAWIRSETFLLESYVFPWLLAAVFYLLYFKRTTIEKSDLKSVRKNLIKCRKAVRYLLVKTNCAPLMLRLAWSDAATFDRNVRMWPSCGGAIGSIRFESEHRHESNAGLVKALCILGPIKQSYPDVSWADLIQMAGALAVEVTGGPKIKGMVYGRQDSPNFHEIRNSFTCPFKPHDPSEDDKDKEDTSADNHRNVSATSSSRTGARRTHTKKEGDVVHFGLQLASRLPKPLPPYPDSAPVPGTHIRNVFYRLGFSNREIVALCGAHTLGRAFGDRSGACLHVSGPQVSARYMLSKEAVPLCDRDTCDWTLSCLL